MPNNQVIVVGGGLSGLSCAHTVIERGGSVSKFYANNKRVQNS